MNLIKRTTVNLVALSFAAAVTYILGAVFSTIFVLAANPYDVPLKFYVTTAISDIKGLTLYFVIIFIGFIIAFPIAAVIRKALPKLASIGYPLAGATAIAVALGLMYVQFETVPISGARGLFGFACQMFAGAIGGLTFAKFHKPVR